MQPPPDAPSHPRRALAFVIDSVLVGIPAGLAAWFGVRDGFGGPFWVSFWTAVAVWYLVLPLLEWRTGRTPGKAVAGLRVVSADGRPLRLRQIAIRRLPYWFGLIYFESLFMLLTHERVRPFDILAGTKVIQPMPGAPG